MGDHKAAKLQKCHKVRLIEAIATCMARINLLESREDDDGDVRSELRKLKTSVFANASNGVVTQDTKDPSGLSVRIKVPPPTLSAKKVVPP
jgi:hypothetical protein